MMGVFSEASVMKPKGKPGGNQLNNVPTKTIFKVVAEKKGASSTTGLASSKSTNNLSKENVLKSILSGNKNTDQILEEILEATNVDKSVNIRDVKNSVPTNKKVSFKDELATKSTQLKGKSTTSVKTPAAAAAKGVKTVTPANTQSKSKTPASDWALKKVASAVNLAKNIGNISKVLNKTKSTTNISKPGVRGKSTAPIKTGNVAAKPAPEVPFMLKGLEIHLNPIMKKSMDIKLLYVILEAKSIIIQRTYRKHFYRRKIKLLKLTNFSRLIQLSIAKKIFRIVCHNYDRLNYINYLENFMTVLLENLKLNYLFYRLGWKNYYIFNLIKIQRSYKAYTYRKLRKFKFTKLKLILKFIDYNSKKNHLIRMKLGCDYVRTRDTKLRELIEKINYTRECMVLRDNIKRLQNFNKRVKAVTKMENFFLYKLINDYTFQHGNNEQYFTITDKIVIRDEEEEGFIDNLKKDAFVKISTYVKAKIKNFLITQFMVHSLEGGVSLVSKRLKLIFKQMCDNIFLDRYYINFNENQENEQSSGKNPFNKIKLSTQKYFLENLFKIQKNYLEYLYTNESRGVRKKLFAIVNNKFKSNKKILEKYFKKYKSITFKRFEDPLERALYVLKKDIDVNEIYLNFKEKKLKRLITKFDHKYMHFSLDCFEHWRKMNALHFVVVKIQTAWRNYEKKGVDYLAVQNEYASWSIHLKKMRKMEDIFKTLFIRTHRMTFKWFVIKLANFASDFGRPGSPYRARRDNQIFNQYDTVVRANTAYRKAKKNYTRYILFTILNNRCEKETLIFKNYFQNFRRIAKFMKSIDSVVIIQKFLRLKVIKSKYKKMMMSKKKLFKMFRKSFLNHLLRAMKIIKITFYEFFMAKDYESDNPENNQYIQLINNIKSVLTKRIFKNIFLKYTKYRKLTFIQIFWKFRLKLNKNKRVKEILRFLMVSKNRHNRRVFNKAFERWLSTSLYLSIGLAVDVLSKFIYNNYVLKKRFKKFLRRIIIRRIIRDLTQCYIFGKNRWYGR